MAATPSATDVAGAGRRVVLVRHASAGQRELWDGADEERPLDETGRAQAAALVGLLTTYDVERIHTSDARRCVETITPLAVRLGLQPRVEPLLSEAGATAEPAAATERLLQITGEAGTTVVCTQRKTLQRVLPAVLLRLGGDPPEHASPDKGGLLVLELADGSATVRELPPPA